MANLMEGLLEQRDRVRDLVKIYEELPGGVGIFGAAIMKQNLKLTDEAITTGDVVKMARAYEELKGHE